MNETSLKLAERALEPYGLHNAKLQVVRHLGNLICHVQTPEKSYALRVCTPDINHDCLSLELAWSLDLNENTPLTLPLPQPTRSGELVSEVQVDNETRLVALFNWLPGEPISTHMNVQLAAKLGASLAHLHCHAAQWKHPLLPTISHHDRYDLAWIEGPKSWWGSGQARRDLGRLRTRMIAPAMKLLIETMRAWNEQPSKFGLIHGDLHFGNALTHQANVAILDFDAFGLGYYLFDLAVTGVEFIDRGTKGRAELNAFLDSYRTINPFLAWTSREWNASLIAANYVFIEWVYTSNDTVRAEKQKYVPSCLRQMCTLGVQERILASINRWV